MILTYVVLAILAALDVIEAFGFLNALKSERRQAARERDILINQVMHLSGKTWSPPPAEAPYPPNDGDDEDYDPSRFVTDFATIPDEYDE